MNWPYQFVALNDDQQLARRHLLDRYGVYAQLSAIFPVLAYQLYRLGLWISFERQKAKPGYAAIPASSHLKSARLAGGGVASSRWRSFWWWLGGDIFPGSGPRGNWVVAFSWTTWLLFLAVHKTGNDYLHLTKRLGVIAASQFPLHYVFSMKSTYSPLALAFGTSHEHLNPYHRFSGRIVYSLLLLHATFYMNFFIQSGLVAKRLTSLVPLLGVAAFSMLTILAGTSLTKIRRWNYRVFFLVHVSVAFCILPILFFHTPALRLYVVESLMIFILDLVLRKLDTVTAFSKITSVPHTKLLKLTIPIPASKMYRFHQAAGQHVYLSIPPESTPIKGSLPLVQDSLFNPFTVARVTSTEITLVLRVLRGPTSSALRQLAKLSKAMPPLNIEGPYGGTAQFPNLEAFDRVLLVAGGVGATFILPIYRRLEASKAAAGTKAGNIKFIWAMRSAAEAAWEANIEETEPGVKNQNVKVYLTAGRGGARDSSGSIGDGDEGSVELSDLSTADELIKVSGGHSRPDLGKLVDETFRQGEEERVAVLVCGPKGMAEELRYHVGRWVDKGRDVWWHNESFGW